MPELKTLFYPADKNILLLRITCLCWLFAKVMSWRIWTTNRLLPTAPVFEWLDYAPAIVHTVLFIISLLLLILLLFIQKNKRCLTGLLGVEIALCFLDQNRLLPWEYQYMFMTFIFLINSKNQKYIRPVIAFLLISTYFYSGLSKLNESFLHTVWTRMILTAFFKMPPHITSQNWVHYSGYLLGTIELLAAIGLLFVKTQVNAARVLIGMHLFILLLLGPFGLHGYRVLWPWNIAMILFLASIFLYRNDGVVVFDSITKGWNKVVVLFWGILPAFSFFGYWDKNLSSNLFSADVPKMTICVRDTSMCKPLQRFCYRKDTPNTCKGLAKIDIQNWAIIETSVSAYPEVRVYKQMQAKLEKQYPASGLNFVYFIHWDKN